MKRNILWIFLVTAPLVTASPLGIFEATCSGQLGGCVGSYEIGGTPVFSFGGPFPGFSERFPLSFGVPPPIDMSIGTNGGSFLGPYGGVCDYYVDLFVSPCYGEVLLGADLAPSDDTGLSVGDVVSVIGPGTVEGWWCYGEACNAIPAPLFNLHVRATYQFTLTDPGTPAPFSWTGAEFSFSGPVPEPGTWVFATLGLAGMTAGFRGWHRDTRTRV